MKQLLKTHILHLGGKHERKRSETNINQEGNDRAARLGLKLMVLANITLGSGEFLQGIHPLELHAVTGVGSNRLEIEGLDFQVIVA